MYNIRPIDINVYDENGEQIRAEVRSEDTEEGSAMYYEISDNQTGRFIADVCDEKMAEWIVNALESYDQMAKPFKYKK